MNNPSYFKGADLPVENVSWDEVQDFISKLNEKGNKYSYRLPTEAEWEYACRAGSTGDYAGNLDEMGWYGNNSGSQHLDVDKILRAEGSDGINYMTQLLNNNCRPHSVGQKRPNAWGLCDMYGNVWEWCQDWVDHYPFSKVIDPQGPSSGSRRVMRGGGWHHSAGSCSSVFRYASATAYRSNDLGFRLARTQK